MSEDRYRLVKAFLLTVLVVGLFVVGFRIADTYRQAAENGRYRQYDLRKEFSPDGSTHRTGEDRWFYDSRSGEVLVTKP